MVQMSQTASYGKWTETSNGKQMERRTGNGIVGSGDAETGGEHSNDKDKYVENKCAFKAFASLCTWSAKLKIQHQSFHLCCKENKM